MPGFVSCFFTHGLTDCIHTHAGGALRAAAPARSPTLHSHGLHHFNSPVRIESPCSACRCSSCWPAACPAWVPNPCKIIYPRITTVSQGQIDSLEGLSQPEKLHKQNTSQSHSCASQTDTQRAVLHPAVTGYLLTPGPQQQNIGGTQG